MASVVQKVNKIVEDELTVLNKGVVELQLAKQDIDESYRDLAGLMKYVNDIVAIDLELEHLFKTVRTAFRKVQKNLTDSQERAYQARMGQIITQVVDIQTRVHTLVANQKSESQKLRALDDKLRKNMRILKGIFKNMGKYAKKTEQRGEQIGDIASRVHDQIRSTKINRGPIAAQKMGQARSRLKPRWLNV